MTNEWRLLRRAHAADKALQCLIKVVWFSLQATELVSHRHIADYQVLGACRNNLALWKISSPGWQSVLLRGLLSTSVSFRGLTDCILIPLPCLQPSISETTCTKTSSTLMHGRYYKEHEINSDEWKMNEDYCEEHTRPTNICSAW